jgi:hypothetical protein
MNALELSIDLQCQLIRDLGLKSDARQMLGRLAERVGTDVAASACAIYTIDKGGHAATQRAGSGHESDRVGTPIGVVVADQVIEKPAEDQKLGLTGWTLSTGTPVVGESYSELSTHPHWRASDDLTTLGVRSGTARSDESGEALRIGAFVGLPLYGVGGEVIGAIKAERRERPREKVKPFTVHEHILLETAARVASMCLAYLEMADEGCDSDRVGDALDRTITAWAREAVAEAAASEVEMDSFLAFVSQIVAAAMCADACGIYLIDEIDPTRRTLTQRAGCGSQEPLLGIRSYPLPTQEQIDSRAKRVGLTAWIAATGESFHASNNQELRNHPHHRGEFDKWNFPVASGTQCGAFQGVPLRLGGSIIGVLKVENQSILGVPDLRDFPPEALRRLDLLAQDVALVVARPAGERLGARYQLILAAQPTIFGILQGSMDVRTLVEKVVKDTAILFKARACALFLKDGNRLIQPRWAAMGWAARGPEVREYTLLEPWQIVEAPRMPEEKVSLTVWIAATRRMFTARSNVELRAHPHHRGVFDNYSFQPGERCESFMGVPLVVGDRLVGVLKVETKQKLEAVADDGRIHEEVAVTYFSEQDELGFDLIAKSAAIAIENARFSEAERIVEQIRNNMQYLLVYLHEFVRDHLWAAETLNRAADLLRRDHPNLAQIVQSYADLLRPQITPYLLQEFCNQIRSSGDFLVGSRGVLALYAGFADALSVANLTDIARLSASPEATGRLDALQPPRFFLADAVGLALDLYREAEALEVEVQRGEDAPLLRLVRERVTGIGSRAQSISLPERNLVQHIAERWCGVIDKVVPPFVRLHPIPYVAGPPIHPLAQGQFFGRRDLFDWVAKNLWTGSQANTLVLHGERRMGKTSILLQLQSGDLGKPLRDQAGASWCPVFVDLQALSRPSTAGLLHDIASSVQTATGRHPAIGNAAPLRTLRDFEQHTSHFNRFMEETSKLLGTAKLVIMLDEFETLDDLVTSGTVDRDIYGQLRHQMLHLRNVAFIIAGTPQLETKSDDYRGLAATFGLQREVGFMEMADARALVEDPVRDRVVYESSAIDELVRATHGHPFLLQALGHRVISNMNDRRTSNYITSADAQKAIADFVKEGAALLDYLWQGLNSPERAVLSSLAEAGAEGEQFRSSEELTRLSGMDREALDLTLRRLLRRHLIEKVNRGTSPGGISLYELSMPIFGQWIRSTL